METKKISQLPVVEGLSESVNVLVEENGMAKRIPASNAIPSGVVKSVNGVTPDEAGNVTVDAGNANVNAGVEIIEFRHVLNSEGGYDVLCNKNFDEVNSILREARPFIARYLVHYSDDDEKIIGYNGANILPFCRTDEYVTGTHIVFMYNREPNYPIEGYQIIRHSEEYPGDDYVSEYYYDGE